MKKIFVVCIFLVFWLCSTVNATDIIIVTEDIPPYNYTINGVITGISTEVVEAAFGKAGIKYTIRSYPWARAISMATNGENILIYSILKTPERESLFKWVGEIAPRKSYFYKLKTREDITINSIEDAKQYIVGGVRGDARVEFLVNSGFDIKEIVPTDEMNIRKLNANRIELMIGNELTFAYIVKSIGFNIDDFEKAFFLEEFSKGDFYMAFGISTSDELVMELKSALDTVKADGTYDRILDKYLSE